MVMRDRAKPRETFVLVKGAYDNHAQKVTHGVPAFLPKLPTAAPANRLTLAQWLVSPEHPLTTRVSVNRIWQTLFGIGLVKTVEDFGVQGDQPSHPDLLDWLAVELRESGWDVKKMIRLIVTSATYRQSSKLAPGMAERDPENRLLARGPRHRLPSWMLRDQALAVGGLFGGKIRRTTSEGLSTGRRLGGCDLWTNQIQPGPWRCAVSQKSLHISGAESWAQRSYLM